MIGFTRKATVGFAAALMLVGGTASVYGFTGVYSSLTRAERQIQLAGKLVCTQCSLEDARKTQPRYANFLYQLRAGQEQLVLDVRWASASVWLHHLMTPRIRMQGEESLLALLTAKDNNQRNVVISGILLDSQTLDVKDVNVHR